ncbi:phage DNA replication protein (predicted replicative helicase loader) [Pseudomonas delhiensis]|uniref:Phage DNA replication protein (Predicted replicative helicase loader) n=1 Tax=Pseudomonas delhiensis TaxID=366289 RepID=A0A239MZ96_9PSED|nr:ATP-binding protein [Pseudomonas delhiensis]SDK39659.1 phage DNA replication protein (predicted replicative helicase loader) [Pseudomonas delhiensis]SNT48036.1 phage DNA replication protein (predicted replicative helicase loader) [Pseudomonas delhiensis]
MASEKSNVVELPGPMTYRDTCEKHGEYQGKITEIMGRQFKSGCAKCSEERRAAEAAAEIEAKAREDRERLQRKLGSAMIPTRFADKTFENYAANTPRQQKALNACRDYADRFPEHYDAGRCLMLLGRPGTGKTHLGAAIANDIIHRSSALAVYRTVGGVLQYIKGSYDRDAEYTEVEAFKSLISPHLLILDEVGATKPTEFELATLFAIINGRYEEKLPTVVISNLPPKELPEAIGDRCVDRLREGGGIVVGFDWESARGVQA